MPSLFLRPLCALLLAPVAAPAQTSTEPYAWLFTSFRGSGDGLHLASSPDGRAWSDLGRIFLKPTVGSKLMRDPHLLRGPDGVFRLVWTTGWKDKGIGYASSPDLLTWSEPKYLPLLENVPGTQNAWAPETVYDAATAHYVITWSSDIEGRFPETKSKDRMNNRTYCVTTKDFETFSEPKLLLDPGFDHIDFTVIPFGGKFLAVFKEGDMQAKGKWGPLHSAVGDSVLGPWRVNPAPIITERAEGPTLVSTGGKTILYVDFYTEHRYGAYETTDGTTWTNISPTVSPVKGQRHGTVLAAPAALVDKLRASTESEKRAAEAAALASVPRPILDGFTADPSLRLFGDTYYVYPTSDKPNWQTTDFSVWSSKNLVEWKKERMILDVTKEVKWANIEAWAPDCIERDGTYFFYFCAQHKIGVATAKHPAGPFVDALGKPLLDRKADKRITSNTIDPYPFIDDDGQAYLYWGNSSGQVNVFKLNRDMVSVDGEPKEFVIKGRSSGQVVDFREGIVVFKRQGKYYFMWSVDDARSDNYRVAYGTGDSPFGPVTIPEKSTVLLKNGAAKGTGHHSIVHVPGTDRWYAAYHRHAVPVGGGYQRETCLVRMEFDTDGSIKPMDPLTSPFKPGDVGEPIVNGQGLPGKK